MLAHRTDSLRPNRVSDITVHSCLQSAEPAWRSVADRSACYVFQSFEWMALWCRTCAEAEHTTPFIVCLTGADGRPALVLPLGVRAVLGCRILRFLGGATADYNAPLIDPGFASSLSEAESGQLWRDIIARARCDVVSLARMPEKLADGAVNPLLRGIRAAHSANAYATAPLPNSFADFAAGRSHAYFADTRRKRRKLERAGAVELHIASVAAEAASIAETMLRQKRRRIVETGARPMPAQDERFFRALAQTPISHGRPHVSCLRVNGEVVATHLGAHHRNRFYWLMPGFEAGEWARYSVGRALLHALVERCIADRVEVFDLTVGDEEYKRFWSNTCLKLFDGTFATSPRGAAFLAARRLRLRWFSGQPKPTGAAAQD